MLCVLLMFIFGVAALVKGEFKITGNRKVSGQIGRVLGVILLVGAFAGLAFAEFGALVQAGAFILVVILGLAMSEKIEKDVSPPEVE